MHDSSATARAPAAPARQAAAATSPFAPVLDLLHLQAAMLDVSAATFAPPRLIAQRQQQRLLRLLEAAREGSPLYRERIGAASVRGASLLRVAPVTRGELMERFDDWVTDPALKRDELAESTADPARIGQAWRGKYMVWESSGTSGQPGVFVQDAQAMAVYDALEAVRHRVPARGGAGLLGLFAGAELLGATDRLALVSATGGHFASVVSFERLRGINPWLQATTASFSVLQPTAELVAALNEFQPTLLATYPTAAALLADEADAGRLTIRPRCVLTGGETLSAAVRARVAEAFSAPVRSSYGTSEFLPMAWECAHGRLHVNEDWLVLEPVDERGQAMPPGQRSHSVLLTNLANLVQPLIRYDLGDQVTLHGQRCACGSALPTIDLQGRRDDILRVASREAGQTVGLLPLALSTVIEEQAGVFDDQIEQRGPSTLVLRVSLQGEAAQQAIERCREAIGQFVLAQGARPVRVLGEAGCQVPRGRSGKACRVALDGRAG